MTFWDGTSYEKKVTIQDVACSSKNGLIEYKNTTICNYVCKWNWDYEKTLTGYRFYLYQKWE